MLKRRYGQIVAAAKPVDAGYPMIASRLIRFLVSGFITLGCSGSLSADNFDFLPIPGSAYGRENDVDIDTQPFLIPMGYQQRILSSERDLNLYRNAEY